MTLQDIVSYIRNEARSLPNDMKDLRESGQLQDLAVAASMGGSPVMAGREAITTIVPQVSKSFAVNPQVIQRLKDEMLQKKASGGVPQFVLDMLMKNHASGY